MTVAADAEMTAAAEVAVDVEMTVDAEMTTDVGMTAAAEIPMAGIIRAEEIPTEGVLRTGNPADRVIAAVRKRGLAARQTTVAVNGTVARLPE